jgi:hypothetical protein
VRKFYEEMSHDLDWLPDQPFGAAAGISPVMEEFRKSLARTKGFPLVQSLSFGASERGGRIGPSGPVQQRLLAGHDPRSDLPFRYPSP